MSQKNNESLLTEEFDPAGKVMSAAQEFWNKHKNLAVGILVIISIAVLAYGTLSHLESEKVKAASLAFTTAEASDSTLYIQNLSNVYAEHAGTEYAFYSAYLVAQRYLLEGDADNAIVWFDKSMESEDKGMFLISEAIEGKGIAKEMKGDFAGAKELYSKVVSNENSHRANATRLKLSYLQVKDGDVAGAKANCEAIVADTTAQPALKMSAQELLASLSAK